jgi:hypothetical protein
MAQTLEEWGHGVDTPSAEDVSEPVAAEPKVSWTDMFLRDICRDQYRRIDYEKIERIRDLPLTQLAIHGMRHFNPPNGNKGKPFASRRFGKGQE